VEEVEEGRSVEYATILVPRLLSLRYPRRYSQQPMASLKADFPAICRSIYFHLRCQSASAACKLRQVVIGGLQAIAPCTCIDALLGKILLCDMVYYKARSVPCVFRTCMRWRALDRLLMISAAESRFTATSTLQNRQASSPRRIQSSPTYCKSYKLSTVQHMRYAHDILAWHIAKIENARIDRCSGRAGSARFEQAPVSQTRRCVFSTPSRNPFI
jgi:hypothetical protein